MQIAIFYAIFEATEDYMHYAIYEYVTVVMLLAFYDIDATSVTYAILARPPVRSDLRAGRSALLPLFYIIAIIHNHKLGASDSEDLALDPA